MPHATETTSSLHEVPFADFVLSRENLTKHFLLHVF